MKQQHQEGPPRFSLGQVLVTFGALEALQEAGQLPFTYLHRHQADDRDDLAEEDKAQNYPRCETMSDHGMGSLRHDAFAAGGILSQVKTDA